jgi:hypothetical protein
MRSECGKIVKEATKSSGRTLGLQLSDAEPNVLNQPGWTSIALIPIDKFGDFEGEWKGINRVWDTTHTNHINKAKINRLICGFNASKAEEDKIKAYSKHSIIPADRFIPLGFEGRGAWGNEAARFYKTQFTLHFKQELTDAQPNSNASIMWNRATQEISNALRRTNTLYLDHIRFHKQEMLSTASALLRLGAGV